jgi:ribosome-binding protein aMBF1 (putative translation factor)
MKSAERCPVCDWQITGEGVTITVGGKEITVCCDECGEKVKEDPSRHAEPAS